MFCKTISRRGWQGHFYKSTSNFLGLPWKAVRCFLDLKTFEKVKFVYPRNKDSVELMSTFFHVENLPAEFGGKATLMCNHKELSKMEEEEDVKTARFWSSDDKPCPIPNSNV
ncbi:hypothetical protein MLD38_007761 [Melastoma candidum]|uniref:Uncharacterized protein n=1 Tax=Melastoma candidum TaxID=119954 RepID=A0ACB9RV58_9MYRT|nr:hypothetical protein MLD38_007761 [Melastoma candidum]